MNTRQLLLVNLLTDALPALAIATRPPTKLEPEQVLAEGPARSLGTALNRQILWRATVTGVVATGAWALARVFGPRTASTVARSSTGSRKVLMLNAAVITAAVAGLGAVTGLGFAAGEKLTLLARLVGLDEQCDDPFDLSRVASARRRDRPERLGLVVGPRHHHVEWKREEHRSRGWCQRDTERPT